MPGDPEDLLRQARDELYHMRVVANGLRNRLKTDAAVIADCEQRMQSLIAEIEARRNGSPGQRRPTDGRQAHLTQTH